jgi:hypothetical protein
MMDGWHLNRKGGSFPESKNPQGEFKKGEGSENIARGLLKQILSSRAHTPQA